MERRKEQFASRAFAIRVPFKVAYHCFRKYYRSNDRNIKGTRETKRSIGFEAIAARRGQTHSEPVQDIERCGTSEVSRESRKHV